MLKFEIQYSIEREQGNKGDYFLIDFQHPYFFFSQKIGAL